MRILERTVDRLIVEDNSWRVALFLVAGACFVALYGTGTRASPPGRILVAILLLVGAWFSRYRARLVLGPDRLRHELRRIGRTRVREHPTTELANVSLSNPPGSRDEDDYLLRLELRDGESFVVTPGTFGRRDVQPVADAIRELADLGASRTVVEEARAMAEAGDVIGAVAFLRKELGLSLESAKERVGAMRAEPGPKP